MIIYLAVLVALGIAAVAVRDPLVRRIGLRNATRRPREAALVMLGCVLGTALIVGNSSVGDSFTASIRDQALREFGSLEAVVDYDTRAEWVDASARLASSSIKHVATTTPTVSLRVPITSDASDVASPRATLVESDYRRAGSIGRVPGIGAGIGPSPGTAWVSPEMAKELHLRTGSTLTLHSQPPVTLTVAHVVDNPLLGFLKGNFRAGHLLLVPPGTVLGIADRAPSPVFPRFRTLVVADEASVAEPVAANVDSVRTALTDLVTPFNGSIRMVRSDSLRAAVESGQSTGATLTTIGSFGIIAGLLLLVNVLLMLAEERLAELGTMRAVGMSRRPLVGSFSLEGGLYAAVGAFIGGGVGVLLGRLLVGLISSDVGDDGFDRGLEIFFAPSGATIVRGIAAGFLVAAVAVIATSYRVSRLDVIRSLRGLPDQSHLKRRVSTPLLGAIIAVGGLLVYVGSGGGALLQLLGVVIVSTCVGSLVARRFGWQRGTITGALPIAAFCVAFNVISHSGSSDNATSIVIAGVVGVTACVFLVNAGQTAAATVLRRIGRGRASLPTRLGLANPVAHRVRMMLTVGPFALVVFTLAYAEGLAHLIDAELRNTAPRIGGDYTVLAESSAVNPYDFRRIDASEATHIARTGTVAASFTYRDDQPPRPWPVTSFNGQFLHVTPPPLIARDKAYASDADAYRAVLSNPNLIIAHDDFLATFDDGVGRGDDDPPPVALGQTFAMFNPLNGESRDVTVAGIAYDDMFGQGAFYGEPTLRAMFGDQYRQTDAFLVATGSVDGLIANLQRDGLTQGLEASDIKGTARAFFGGVNSIIQLFRADLGIGVVVGVAGISVVLIRSVRERRHQIGVLRAMGFDAGEIGTSFLVEGGFVAAQGLLIGVGFGYLTVLSAAKGTFVFNILGYHPGFPAPTSSTMVLTVLMLVVAIGASAIPARAASKIPPAIALRLVD